MSYSNGQPMEPPFLGFVRTTGDALLIFQAARTSVIPRVTRRLTDTERHNMIKSGSVFVWNEQECPIKRWTDSMTWSPSRIIGNFLVYRETTERGSGRSPAARAARLAMRSRDPNRSAAAARPRPPDLSPEELAQRTHERSIVGSLADDLGTFKPGGLVKKTMSLVIDGINHHLISYYNPDDVKDNRLSTPSSIPRISAVGIPPDLLDRRRFSQPPRVELVNGVITYAGESAEDSPLPSQGSPTSSTNSEAGPSLTRTPSPGRLSSQLAFFSGYAGATDTPYDISTMPPLKIAQFDFSGDTSFAPEASPRNRNPSRRPSLSSYRHEPYPTSSSSRSRCRLSVPVESPTVLPRLCGWSGSEPSIDLRQSNSFDVSAESLAIAQADHTASYGPYSAPASMSGYSDYVENSFPAYFPSFNLAPDPEARLESSDVTYGHQYVHPHSPPPTPRTGALSPPLRPSLSVDTHFEHRFAYSCPPSTVPHHDTLVTPPPTACTDPSVPSAQFAWEDDTETSPLDSGYLEEDLRHSERFTSTNTNNVSESAA